MITQEIGASLDAVDEGLVRALISACGYQPKSGPGRRYDRSTPSNRHSSAEVGFRPDFVGCTSRCGRSGRGRGWSLVDPQRKLRPIRHPVRLVAGCDLALNAQIQAPELHRGVGQGFGSGGDDALLRGLILSCKTLRI